MSGMSLSGMRVDVVYMSKSSKKLTILEYLYLTCVIHICCVFERAPPARAKLYPPQSFGYTPLIFGDGYNFELRNVGQRVRMTQYRS